MRVIALGLALTLATPSLSDEPLTPDQVDARPSTPPTATQPYGAEKYQVGDLRVPKGKGPFPVAVVVHGGCWTHGYANRKSTAPLASNLTEHGVATWNIDYRQLNKGGGWPGTFVDWGLATDYLRTLAKTYPLDLKRVYTVGHSAGAHGALWIAARRRLPATSEIRGKDPLPIKAAVAIDGPADLASFIGIDAMACGQPAIVPLLGGQPDQVPVRYTEASPERLLPLKVRQYIVTGQLISPAIAGAYRDKAAKSGDKVDVLELKGASHFDMIAPGLGRWREVEPFLLGAVGGK